MILLIRQHKFDINPEFLQQNAKYFRNALVMASLDEYSETIHLEVFINELLNIHQISDDINFKEINDYNTDHYDYDEHIASDD